MRKVLIIGFTLWVSVAPVGAQLTGQQNFVVLYVQFQDMTGATFSQAQVQSAFDNIKTLWGTDSSYAAMSPNFRISSLYKVPKNTASYIDIVDGGVGNDSSSPAAFSTLVTDAVANAPAGTDWSNLRGVVILFADNRANGFYRGITFPGVTISPTGASQISLPISVVGEDPQEGLPTAWGRIAHEVGHEMQQALPAHPSDYNSSFEQMDAEYPAQTGVFEKQSNTGFPGWLPASKYKAVNPPAGADVPLLSEEIPPGNQPNFQAAKAFLNFGGNSVYYLVSVRRRTLGDDLATTSPLGANTDCNAAQTPNGIPDCGVLIERVVEGGDPNLQDCDPQFNCANRWVNVLGNGGNSSALWHAGDTYNSTSYAAANNVPSVKNDDINISVRSKVDADHYDVIISYGEKGIANQPDAGLQSWLQPPGNTYETTDIWIDSPINGYASPPDSDALHYRYGIWADQLGGTVPIGNGDNPAIGLVNRLYARVRNYGTQPATNVTVFFDMTSPPGLGINGSNGFVQLGSVGPAQFPGLTSIPPGGHVDVYLTWTPNFPLTPQQIAQGIFFFHTCVRVRLSHVPGETFFANQDGDGQQENIEYFDATGAGGQPGAPGPANKTVVHLRNDSPAVPKTFLLGLLRDTLPSGWTVTVNGGQPVVKLAPGQEKDVPVSIEQGVSEPIGSHHRIRVIASSMITFTNPSHPTPHNEAHTLSGVTFDVAVLRKTTLSCKAKNGVVSGTLRGLDPRDADKGALVYVVPITVKSNKVRFGRRGVLAPVREGKFQVKLPFRGLAVCLYAGGFYSTPAGSAPCSM
jgi:hypothetical protein